VLFAYLAIGWTLRRGFDWSDESFVYAMIASNREAIGEPWGFQHLLYPLYVLTGQSVLAFRVIRLAGYLLLSVGLVWTARFVMRLIGVGVSRSGWVFILLLAQVGTFFAWSYPPRYLGYNELASWFAQGGVALILISLAWGASASPGERVASASPGERVAASPDQVEASAPTPGPAWVLWLVWGGLGAVTMLLIFAKVSSAVAFAAVLALAVFIPNRYLRLWKRVVAGLGGGVAVLLVLWVCRSPVDFYLTNLRSLVFDPTARAGVGRPLPELFTTYRKSLVLTGRALFPAVGTFALLAVTLRLRDMPIGSRALRWAIDAVAWALAALLVRALVVLPRVVPWTYLGELVSFIGLAGIIGLVVLGPDRTVLHRLSVRGGLSVAVGGAAIVAAPFVSSFGTANPIAGQLLFAATLWAVMLGVALVLLAQRAALLRSSTRAIPGLVGCVVILLAAYAVKAEIAKPYRTPPLLSQTTSVSAPELRGLLLTSTDAAWIDWVSAAGDSLGAEGVPATAIYASGPLFVFNHSGYANPWVGSKWPAAYRSLTLACANRPSDLFVLQPGGKTARSASTRGVTKSLAGCGIRFPGDFRIVDRRLSGDPARAMTIWRLKSG